MSDIVKTGYSFGWYDEADGGNKVIGWNAGIKTADVIVYAQDLLDTLGLDADEIINMKMDQNEKKYPVEKAKGSAAKYDKL